METGPKKDEESIYHAALSMPAIERSAFLEKQCEGDEELLSRIEILLANSEEVGDFLINITNECQKCKFNLLSFVWCWECLYFR